MRQIKICNGHFPIVLACFSGVSSFSFFNGRNTDRHSKYGLALKW
jgi:hypothetical protein